MFSPCKITFNTYDWIKRIDFTPYIYIFVGWHVILEDLSSLAQHCSKFLLCIRMPHNLIRWLNSNAIASMIVHVGFPDPQIPSFDPQVTLSIKAKIYLWIVAHHLETFSIAIFPRIRLNRRKENIPLRASRHDLNLISKFKKDTIFALINYISFQLHLNHNDYHSFSKIFQSSSNFLIDRTLIRSKIIASTLAPKVQREFKLFSVLDDYHSICKTKLWISPFEFLINSDWKLEFLFRKRWSSRFRYVITSRNRTRSRRFGERTKYRNEER